MADLPDIKIKDFKVGDDPEWVDQHPGRLTGSVTKPTELPVTYLIKLPALRDEHRQLHMDMPKIKGMAESCVLDDKWRQNNPMTLNVLHNGRVLVEDGSHRIRAAKLAKLKTYPCVIKFYGGSEDDFDIKKILGKYASDVVNLRQLVVQAQSKINANEDYSELADSLIKLAEDVPGSTADFGQPVDQDYNNKEYDGVDYNSTNDPDKGKMGRFGPVKSDNNMVQEASELDVLLRKASEIADELKQRLNVPGIFPMVKAPGVDRGDTRPKSPIMSTRVNQVQKKIKNPGTPMEHQQLSDYDGGGNLINSNYPRIRELTPVDKSILTNPKHNLLISNNSAKNADKLADGECAKCGSTTNDIRGHLCDKCAFPDGLPDKKSKDEKSHTIDNKDRSNSTMLSDKKEASANKPCVKCGMPSDACVCMDDKAPTNGNDPSKVAPTLDNRMDPTKAAAINLDDIIHVGKLTKEASHVETIEIPFKDLNLETGINYKMSGRDSEVFRLLQRYLHAHVYPGHLHFSIVRAEQTTNKWFVKVLVFDNQISHVADIDTNNNSLHKLSSSDDNKLQKTAWRKRLTETYGTNDQTGCVRCPIESDFVTRACGTCPLAGNPESYIKDGYVECHWDDYSDWLNNGGQRHEHKPFQR